MFAGVGSRPGRGARLQNWAALGGKLDGSVLRPEQFDACGSGKTDDTAALQLCHDAFGPAGGTILLGGDRQYNVGALSFTKPIRIISNRPTRPNRQNEGAVGAGGLVGFSATADIITTTAQLLLDGISVSASVAKTAGAMVKAVNANPNASQSGLVIRDCFVEKQFRIGAIDGYFTQIVGNKFSNPVGDPGAAGFLIGESSYTAGIYICDNMFDNAAAPGTTPDAAIVLRYADVAFISRNLVVGYDNGVLVGPLSGQTAAFIEIEGNTLDSGTFGVQMAPATGGSIIRASVIGNFCSVNSNSGIYFDATNASIDNVQVADNVCNGNTSNGIVLVGSNLGAFDIHDNNVRSNGTGINFTGTPSNLSRVHDNIGYNPVGAASVTTSASPYTYTAGRAPESLYFSASTGISAITQGGVSILPAALAANVPFCAQLEPNEAVVITYTGTLTAKKMVH